MLSYYGELRDRRDHENNDERYRHISDVTFTLSSVGSLSSLQLSFYIRNIWEYKALKQFIEGSENSVTIDGSEGIIKIMRNQREFIFELSYQGPIVKLSFTLDHAACHAAFRALLSDLEKYPCR
jgi:hypothetical protein